MDKGLLGLPERRWLQLALAFNFAPAGYLHDSWLDSLPHGELVQKLRKVPPAAGYVSEYILQTLELNHQYCYDFSKRSARLALLHGRVLEHLFLYLGLTLRNQELRREILGERIRSLRKTLGEHEFAFAIKRAPFLGAIPDFPYEPEASDPRTRFTMIGARFCALSCSAFGEGLLRRMALKLPAAWSNCLLEASADDMQANTDSALPPLIRKLIKETLPQWNPLFV